MSLIAWYPLDGDLHDKSGNANHLSLVGSEANIASATGGKIGRCHERITYNTVDLLRSDNKILLTKEFTMTAWFYSGGSAHTNTANGLVTLHNHVANSNPCLGLMKRTNSSEIYIGCSTGSGTGRTYNAYYGTSDLRGAWRHLTYRYDGTKLELLVDGVIEKTQPYSSFAYTEEYLELFNWSVTNSSSSSYRPNGKMNDVRIYDHCITDLELDEILDAKIVHLSGAPLFGLNLSDGHASGNHYRNSVVNNDDGTFTVTTTGDVGSWYTNSLNVTDMKSDTPYTFGVELIATNDPSYRDHLYFISYQNEGVGDGTKSGTKEFITKTGYMFQSHRTTDSSDILKLTSRIGGASDGNSYWYKFARSVAVQSDTLAREPQDIQSDAVYDRSGYGNDAYLDSTTAGWSSDAAVGASGYYIRPSADGHFNSIKFKNDYLATLPAFTRSLWVKTTDSAVFLLFGGRTGNNVLNSMQIEGGVLACHLYGDSSTGTDKQVATGTSQVSDGVWHHLAMSYADGVYKTYVDGVLEGTGENVNTNPGAAYRLMINYDAGASGSYEYRKMNEGHVSDVRVYASELSAEKINRLSRVRASVVETGVFCASEFVEGWDSDGDLEIEIRSSSSGNTGTFINGVKQGYQSSSRGISFCIYDESMTLRGYGSLDTYSGTTTQYYEFDGTVYVASANDIADSAQEAADWLIHAMDNMEDGWLMTAARCDASTTQNGQLRETFLKYFGVTEDHAIASRGTWGFMGIKNGELLSQFAEGRRYNESGSIVYYTNSRFVTGGYHDTGVTRDGVVHAGELIETNFEPSLLDYSTWVIGDDGGFGTSDPIENLITIKKNPWGDHDVVWQGMTRGTSSSDGGWYGQTVAIDSTKHHRYTNWIQREVTGNGSWYLGCSGSHTENLSGSANTNPYFISSGNLPNGNEWFLVVAYLYAAGTTDTNTYTDYGIYNVNGEKIGNISSNFRSKAGSTSNTHRSFLYYSTDANTIQNYHRPRVDVMDGTQPSIAELCAGAEHTPIVSCYNTLGEYENNATRIKSDGSTNTFEFNEV
ncbi:virion structural protein [Vibrio phage F86]